MREKNRKYEEPVKAALCYSTIPEQTDIKRGPLTPSTESVQSSRLDAADDGEYDSILSNIRILIRGLQCCRPPPPLQMEAESEAHVTFWPHILILII